jgi:hypothetical protein
VVEGNVGSMMDVRKEWEVMLARKDLYIDNPDSCHRDGHRFCDVALSNRQQYPSTTRGTAVAGSSGVNWRSGQYLVEFSTEQQYRANTDNLLLDCRIPGVELGHNSSCRSDHRGPDGAIGTLRRQGKNDAFRQQAYQAGMEGRADIE